MTRKHCPICRKTIIGRLDKKFCSAKCRSDYHLRLKKHTTSVTSGIDKILHRNRAILQEIMGKDRQQMKIPMILLERKKFNFNYITKYHINSKGKTYHYVYDISWMKFSNDEVLLNRRGKSISRQ